MDKKTTRRAMAVGVMLLIFTLTATAQQPAIAFCSLDRALEFKTAKAGDKIALHLTRDLVIKGKALMPHGTRLTAAIVDARDGNALSLVLETATLASGKEVPLMGIVAAVATQPEDLSSDPSTE